MCGEEVPKGRRTFCGEACVHQYKLRNQPRYAALQIYKRDRGNCVICGVDTEEVRREFLRELSGCKSSGSPTCREEVRAKYIEKGWAPLHNRRWFTVDHILPVAEGGGPRDYPHNLPYEENLRSLCVPCHKNETKKLMQRLKEKKK
jgi:5-methylcytosine-specific restriction endonuclease McrA